MRKISLTDGAVSVEILPDCGGAISALRWRTPAGHTYDLLHCASAQDIAAQNARQMSCLPIPCLEDSGNASDGLFITDAAQTGLAEWTVQDASNIRSTLTLHQECGHPKNPPFVYQILQRFELGAQGLMIQITVTNLGVRPMPTRIGLRLRFKWHGGAILRGSLAPLASANAGAIGALLPIADELAVGYRLAAQDVYMCLQHLGYKIFWGWPEKGLQLALGLERGFDYLVLEYHADEQEIWLTPLSHYRHGNQGGSANQLLHQGDSLTAGLLLSPALLTK